MNWYYMIRGGHTHVRVFMNGAKCGDLVFRNEEFLVIRQALDNTPVKCLPDKRLIQPSDLITFFNQDEEKKSSVYDGMTQAEKDYAHASQVRQMMRDGV